jgi:hypothetical protein
VADQSLNQSKKSSDVHEKKGHRGVLNCPKPEFIATRERFGGQVPLAHRTNDGI